MGAEDGARPHPNDKNRGMLLTTLMITLTLGTCVAYWVTGLSIQRACWVDASRIDKLATAGSRRVLLEVQPSDAHDASSRLGGADRGPWDMAEQHLETLLQPQPAKPKPLLVVLPGKAAADNTADSAWQLLQQLYSLTALGDSFDLLAQTSVEGVATISSLQPVNDHFVHTLPKATSGAPPNVTLHPQRLARHTAPVLVLSAKTLLPTGAIDQLAAALDSSSKPRCGVVIPLNTCRASAVKGLAKHHSLPPGVAALAANPLHLPKLQQWLPGSAAGNGEELLKPLTVEDVAALAGAAGLVGIRKGLDAQAHASILEWLTAEDGNLAPSVLAVLQDLKVCVHTGSVVAHC